MGQDVTSGQVKFANDVEWNIPTVMGDGTTPDNWYPYFFFSGTPSHAQHYFQHNGSWLVHVDDLKQGDEVKSSPPALRTSSWKTPPDVSFDPDAT